MTARPAIAAVYPEPGVATPQGVIIRDALSAISPAILVLDDGLRGVFCNDLFTRFFGPETVLGQSLDGLLSLNALFSSPPATIPALFAALAGLPVKDGAVRFMRGDKVFGLQCSPLPQGCLLALADITERCRSEREALERANRDSLTELPNRLAFCGRLQRALASGVRPAVLCIDLDRFKPINDTLGHGIGDALLAAVAGRLRHAVRDTDAVARLGSDEFAIRLGGPNPAEAAALLAKRLIELVGRPYLIEGNVINIGVSVGIAIALPETTDAEALLRNAEVALHRAKADGRLTYRVYQPEMDAARQARRSLELDLRKALALGQLELNYQPQLDLRSRAITGFEALIRWRHPERGMVPPAEFIPLAEEIGLIVPIGEWVIRTACQEAARWPGNVSVAVNVSPLQLTTGKLAESVIQALAAAGLAPPRLEFEITESVMLQTDQTTLKTLHQLRHMGVRVAMDDFGTGHSSLSYLRSFPFDKIKIDQSFVRELFRSADCRAIVRAIATLGASLGIPTTAEGVETAEQMRCVIIDGCTQMQGYLLSRPVEPGAIPALFAGSVPTPAGGWPRRALEDTACWRDTWRTIFTN